MATLNREEIIGALTRLGKLSGDYNQVWRSVEQYLQPGRELKAKYAFDDLWEDEHGSH